MLLCVRKDGTTQAGITPYEYSAFLVLGNGALGNYSGFTIFTMHCFGYKKTPKWHPITFQLGNSAMGFYRRVTISEL
jgi:hypothetical protein